MKKINELTILYADFQDGSELEYEKWLQQEVKNFYMESNDFYERYEEIHPDIIVLELGLPKSIEMIKQIRQKDENVSLIALTKYSTVEILREVVDLSLSSYLIKPVTREQLKEGLLKAAKRINQSGRISLSNECQWDVRSKILLYKNEVIALTKREVKLFELLIQREGNFCSDSQILYSVWGDEFDKVVSNASVRTLVKNLRRKLPEGLITNQYGIGYRITV